MIGIPVGLMASNIGEWIIHRVWLHGLGKNKKSFWSFHWHEHHRESRQHDMYDSQYVKSVYSWTPQGKEALSMMLGAISVAPLFPLVPFFVGTVWYRMWSYYSTHKRAHLDKNWAKENLRWHYDHHMGKNQNANWCVTHPWFDYVVGTRVKYFYDVNGKVVGEENVCEGLTAWQRYVKSLFGDVDAPKPEEKMPRPVAQAA
jgi:hypothetical protein